MRVWTRKFQHVMTAPYPRDVICVELDEERILFVQNSGTWDVALKANGMPREDLWDVMSC